MTTTTRSSSRAAAADAPLNCVQNQEETAGVDGSSSLNKKRKRTIVNKSGSSFEHGCAMGLVTAEPIMAVNANESAVQADGGQSDDACEALIQQSDGNLFESATGAGREENQNEEEQQQQQQQEEEEEEEEEDHSSANKSSINEYDETDKASSGVITGNEDDLLLSQLLPQYHQPLLIQQIQQQQQLLLLPQQQQQQRLQKQLQQQQQQQYLLQHQYIKQQQQQHQQQYVLQQQYLQSQQYHHHQQFVLQQQQQQQREEEESEPQMFDTSTFDWNRYPFLNQQPNPTPTIQAHNGNDTASGSDQNEIIVSKQPPKKKKKKNSNSNSISQGSKITDKRQTDDDNRNKEPKCAVENCNLEPLDGPKSENRGLCERHYTARVCITIGCTQRMQGSTSYCVGHGGGNRCQVLGCTKASFDSSDKCSAHGGGLRCQRLGCLKGAVSLTPFCIGHGGGRRCAYPRGCNKSAQGKRSLCKAHGGGKRCMIKACTRSATGTGDRCVIHGGGRHCRSCSAPCASPNSMYCKQHRRVKSRCSNSACAKWAIWPTEFCSGHGGGRRCNEANCSKGAVHGPVLKCKKHGGGKRCQNTDKGICPRASQTGSQFCSAHGGGRRCQHVDGCFKGAFTKDSLCKMHSEQLSKKSVVADVSAAGVSVAAPLVAVPEPTPVVVVHEGPVDPLTLADIQASSWSVAAAAQVTDTPAVTDSAWDSESAATASTTTEGQIQSRLPTSNILDNLDRRKAARIVSKVTGQRPVLRTGHAEEVAHEQQADDEDDEDDEDEEEEEDLVDTEEGDALGFGSLDDILRCQQTIGQ